MNTDQLARATFVIDRATSDRLTAISRRLGVSRSALVRDVLAEPVELMHRWMDSVPVGGVSAEEAAALRGLIESDVERLIDSHAAQLDLLGVTGGDA